MTDSLAEADAAVKYDAWVTTEDGHLVPQSSSQDTIRRMVGLLELRPEMRVLEIGTGSGYSSALLGHMVSARGHVVSLDIDAGLAYRATKLHERAGNTNVEVHAADGFAGWPQAAPFDRIMGWATPHVLPRAWADQASPGAVIVTPVKIADIALANCLTRCVIDGDIHDGELLPGSFIEMAPEIITEFALPIRYVNASHSNVNGPPSWISAHRLHDQPQDTATRLLDQLRITEPGPGFFDGDHKDWQALTAFILTHSTNPASAGSHQGWGLGTATPDSIAVILPEGGLLHAGSNDATDELHALLDEWRHRGKPGYDTLRPRFIPNTDGWIVRTQNIS